MGFQHRYNAIEEEVDELAKDESPSSPDLPVTTAWHTSSTPVTTAWWKLFLCNLLAAIVGAGAMFAFSRGFTVSQPISDSDSGSGSAAVSVATSTTSTPAADLAIPTPPVEHLTGQVKSQNPLSGKILDCGYSPSEARAKGCVYDVMMQDWVPEPCYDGVLTEKYLAEGNWTWYADGDGNNTISNEDMRKGEHGVAWMSSSYHKAHCVFSWLKIIRALRNDEGISQELLSYDHVLHCSHGALKGESSDEGLGVSAPTNYAKCALYGTWQQDFIPDEHDSHTK